MKPLQLIIIGAFVIFAPPIILGIVVGHFSDKFTGIVAGVILLVVIFALSHRYMLKKAKQIDQDKEDHV